MTRRTFFGITTLLFAGFFFLDSRFPALTGEFQIDPSSELRLEGATNINRFTCNCAEKFPKDTYELVQNDHAYILNLRNTDFRLSTSRLDCGRKAINTDLRKALRAEEFPYIRIEIQSIRLPEDSPTLSSESWATLPVKTQITIAGTRRPLHLAVQAKSLGDGHYQLRSKTEVAMSDFGIEPPKPMLGMIKVEDHITISFDLKVSL